MVFKKEKKEGEEEITAADYCFTIETEK